MSMVSARLAPFGTTIFTEMTRLAQQHQAVNLAQGFPDFDGPEVAKHAATEAVRGGESQYARMFGVPRLNKAIADAWHRATGCYIDPETHVTVTSGCTEAIAATMLGLVNPGDEVILFEPAYDSYRACVAMTGATARMVTLHAPTQRPLPGDAPGSSGGAFSFDPGELRAAFRGRTRAIVVNTPHNPTGKVFTREELTLIAELCVQHGVIAITDEVYERLTYDARLPHVSLATLPGMADRTVTLSSLGKSYSLTGWKIGWAIAWPELTRAVRAAHQFLTFATATPLQHGAAAILEHGEEFVRTTVASFRQNRDTLAAALADIGFRVYRSDGTYFLMADHTPVSGKQDDRAFCERLTREIGVAAIPPSVFYERAEFGRPLVRFAYCKKASTIAEAIKRLRKLGR